MTTEIDQELKSRLVEYVDSAALAVKAGSTMAAERAPEIVRQFITWTIAQNCVFAGLCMTGIVVTVYLSIWSWKRINDPDAFPLFAAPVMIVVALTFGFVECVTAALKAWLAPDVYVIEFLAGLLK
jgi:hypothetical protein